MQARESRSAGAVARELEGHAVEQAGGAGDGAEPMLRAYLAATTYCDHTHPFVQRKARELTRGLETPEERAIAIFYWVRDEIHYRLGFWNRTASETLVEGEGTCTNKANLLVALTRAVGIPAGYGVMDVAGQHYLGPGMLPFFARRVAQRSRHYYAVVHLGCWVKVDPSDDRALVERVAPLTWADDDAQVYRVVEWDGRRDATLNLRPEHILAEYGPVACLDQDFRRTARPGKACLVELLNEGMRALRRSDRPLENGRDILAFAVRNVVLRRPGRVVGLLLSSFVGSIQRGIEPGQARIEAARIALDAEMRSGSATARGALAMRTRP